MLDQSTEGAIESFGDFAEFFVVVKRQNGGIGALGGFREENFGQGFVRCRHFRLAWLFRFNISAKKPKFSPFFPEEQMQIIDRYVFRQIVTATIFIVLVLAVLVLLTQSLRYLELVMNAGASGMTFWAVTFLALPSFFEVIVPIGSVAAVMFIYNRLILDSELVVLKALGFSPLRLARPALILAVCLSVFLFAVMGWIAPDSKASSIALRKDIKARMSSLIFRDGIFNKAGDGLMVFVRDRDDSGDLLGLVIYDARKQDETPSTVIAARGVLVSTDKGHQVLVYDGSRQQLDQKTGVLRRLDFDQYTVDLPDAEQTAKSRTKEADELTLGELFRALKSEKNLNERRQVRLELYKRFLTPLFVYTLMMVALVALLQGNHERRGQGRRITFATLTIVGIEIIYLTSYNLAKTSPTGYALMILTVLLPIVISYFILFKERLMQRAQNLTPEASS